MNRLILLLALFYCSFDLKSQSEENALCEKIERLVDDFTGAVTLNSPMSIKYEIARMIIYKEINETKTTYRLYLSATGATYNINETGVSVIFKDGSKWYKPAKVDAGTSKDGFEYTTYITLTKTELNSFATKEIKKYRLFIYDVDVTEQEAQDFKSYINCIKLAK